MTKQLSNNYIKNSIKLHITPNNDGFTCAVEIDDSCKKNMTFEQKEMCVTLACGLADIAKTDTSGIFRRGVRSQIERDKKLLEKEKKNNSNVIDFLERFNKKRDEEIEEQLEKDPF